MFCVCAPSTILIIIIIIIIIITKHTDDHRVSAFLFQRISTLIQRFNAVAVLGTFAPTTSEEDVLAVPAFLDF